MMPGDQLTPVTMRAARLSLHLLAEPAEGRLDEVRDAVVVADRRPCGSRSSPSRSRASRKRASKWSRPMMPSMRRLHRLRVRLHRREQRGCERSCRRRCRRPGSTAARAPARSPRAPPSAWRCRTGRGTRRRTRARCGRACDRRHEPHRRRSAAAKRSGVYQCGEVGSDGFHFVQPGAVAAVARDRRRTSRRSASGAG